MIYGNACFLMTSYNAEMHIADSIQAILDQTEPNFSLLIVDDNSTDRTFEIINSFSDPRIYKIRNASNLGSAGAANVGLSFIQSKYILRIDSDDICLPNRLNEQLNFMEQHPEIDVCGSYVAFFGDRTGLWEMPLQNTEIKARLIWDNVIANSSAIIRGETLRKNHLTYKPTLRKPPLEDYQLWLNLLPLANFANIPKILVKKREHINNQSAIYKNESYLALKDLFKEVLPNLGLHVINNEIDTHLFGKGENLTFDSKNMKDFLAWKDKLSNFFQQLNFIPQEDFIKAADFKWRTFSVFVPNEDLVNYLQLSDNKILALKSVIKNKLK